MQADLVTALWEVAKDNGWQVRQFTATAEAPFASHVATMARTGILVARHGSTLATSFLLPSGAAVYELLPYNWEWKDLNQIYRNMTRSTGRLHHFAWRATDPKWAQYAEPEDRSRYAHFRASECTSRCAALSEHASHVYPLFYWQNAFVRQSAAFVQIDMLCIFRCVCTTAVRVRGTSFVDSGLVQGDSFVSPWFTYVLSSSTNASYSVYVCWDCCLSNAALFG